MIIIGLTGPTGAGKSSLRNIAEDLGFKVIDCDKIARHVTEKGKPALEELSKAFGDDILFVDGTLNRKELAKKAFSSSERTMLLNETIFPFITKEIKAECDKEKIILDAPTLFESGINSVCKSTIAVLADKEIRLKRIMARDEIDEETALIRMNAGKTEEFYLENADYVIYNNDDIVGVKNELSEILSNILKEI